MIERTSVREPVARLSDLPANCQDDLVYHLLRYNSDLDLLVFFTVENDIIYITAANDQDFAAEKWQIRQVFEQLLEIHCNG